MEMEDLFINAWSTPATPSNFAYFLELCQVNIEARNISSEPITISGVRCNFECVDGLDPFIVTWDKIVTLQPSAKCRPIRINFEVDLSLRHGSNFYRLEIDYSKSSDKRTILYNPHKYIRFDRIGESEKSFFISHKDPEDKISCRKLKSFLYNLGYEAFLAEEEPRPGVDIWTEKIPKAIENSLAVIVFWTIEAAKDPTNIIKELEIANQSQKKIILAIEGGLPIPSGVNVEKEWFRHPDLCTERALKEFAKSIEKADSESLFLIRKGVR